MHLDFFYGEDQYNIQVLHKHKLISLQKVLQVGYYYHHFMHTIN